MDDAPGALAIETVGLTKAYAGVEVLSDLALRVERGEVVGFLGPNGAGKTTTIKLLLGLIKPTRGRATIFGLDCATQPVETHRRLGYVAGEANLWPSLTGEETLHLLGRVQGMVDEAYRAALIARFELDVDKKVRAYSKGNRQKVILIAALMSRPELLVFDEPTSGLDPLMEQAFRLCVREARERGQTIFLSSHLMSEVEALCDRVGVLRSGRLVEMGTLAAMRHLERAERGGDLRGRTPLRCRQCPGVSLIEVEGQLVRCQVQGSIEPLIKELASTRVTRLVSREPSLEELFLAHYGHEHGTREASGRLDD